MNITCIDWKNRCGNPRRKVQTYTTNPETRGGEKGSFVDTIAFCPNSEFFDPKSNMESCADWIAEREKMKFSESSHMQNYQCWGKSRADTCIVLTDGRI